ncbi:MAG TPA: BON domain-containing protein [Pirellulales bacterium]|nr:BON domain-containing protein [Pirellulales bacterium]
MKTPISDQVLNRNVSQVLAAHGLRSPCHITIQTRNGEVTMTGTVLRQQQRDAAGQAVRNVEGVKRIVDRLTIKAPVKQSYEQMPAYVRPLTEDEAAAKAEQAATSEGAPAEPEVEAQKYDKQGKRLKEPTPPNGPVGATAKDNPYGKPSR